MADAVFRHGDPTMADHTAAADIAAGEVVPIGGTTGLTCGVAHLAIANGAKGTLAVGGGVYDCVCLDVADKGDKVWFDDATNKLTTTSTNNAQFGFLEEASLAANNVVEALHHPYV